MQYENMPVLRVLERVGEKHLQQALLHPHVLRSSDMPTIVLVGEPAIQDGVTIDLLCEVPFKKIAQLSNEDDVMLT